MAKFWAAVTLTALAFVLNGCGGSTSPGTSVIIGGGTNPSQYTANLPDGSPMDIEVVDEGAGVISGSFAVAATTGPYAFEAGAFEGSIVGNSVSVDCTTSDGTEFQMTGTQGSNSFQLTRSDIPGTVLTFTFEAADTPSRAIPTSSVSTNCTLGTGGSSGKLTINTTPFSVQGGGVLTEYRGTYAGVAATFWQYNTGQANIVLNIDPITIDSATYSSLRVTDLPTVTATSSTASLTSYSTTTRTQFKTRHILNLAP